MGYLGFGILHGRNFQTSNQEFWIIKGFQIEKNKFDKTTQGECVLSFGSGFLLSSLPAPISHHTHSDLLQPTILRHQT
jgi:hypothetical protein